MELYTDLQLLTFESAVETLQAKYGFTNLFFIGRQFWNKAESIGEFYDLMEEHIEKKRRRQ